MIRLKIRRNIGPYWFRIYHRVLEWPGEQYRGYFCIIGPLVFSLGSWRAMDNEEIER